MSAPVSARRSPRALFARRAACTLAALAALSACEPPDTGERPATAPSGPVAVSGRAGVDTAAPDLTEIARTTFTDIVDHEVTLTDGEWRGDPIAEGGAASPAIGLVRGFRRTGDVTGDGRDEAVVLLWSSSGGSGTFGYIAVVGRDAEGEPVNLGTAPLGDRVEVRALAVEDGRIVVATIEAGPQDAACCPGQKMKRTFALDDGVLDEVARADLGRRSITDLAGVEWRLTHFDIDDPVPPGVDVTLIVQDDRIGGSSGCNRYVGSVRTGEAPGDLTVDMPLAGTLMACRPPADYVERHYLDALQNVTRYSFLAGRLVLTWQYGDGRIGTLLFEPRQ